LAIGTIGVLRVHRTIRSLEAGRCDPVADAKLAASAIFWALRMDGPLNAAAKRIQLLHAPLLVPIYSEERLNAWITELRAFTLARHARIWVTFMQMFGSNEAVEKKMGQYLVDFGNALGDHLRLISVGQFRPQEGDVLVPWAAALSLHGRFWIENSERGLPGAEMMRALWMAA
jgi:hypothetical protein